MEHRRLVVDNGMVVADESWVYAWVDSSGTVIYVGGTGLPVEIRTWLHLTSEDPQVGRILANHPEALTDRVEVLAWKLPPGADRQLVRDALSAELFAGSNVMLSIDPVSAAATKDILISLRR